MQNGRLFELLYFLMEHGGATTAELAQRLEVSERTIRRDIDALSASGIPVYAERGRSGGIRLMERFVLSKALLSEREQDEILCALQTFRATGAPADSRLLPHLSVLFHRAAVDWIDADFSDWGAGSERQTLFALLKQAILEQQVLTFQYYGQSGQMTCRTVEPARLQFKGISWYLQAWCRTRQAFRIFKLDRMKQVCLLNEPCGVHGAPPPIDHTENDLPLLRLRLRFAPSVAFRVYDEFDPATVTSAPDGSLLADLEWPVETWGVGYLLSFGSNVEVIEPPAVRRLLQQETEKILALYKNPDIPCPQSDVILKPSNYKEESVMNYEIVTLPAKKIVCLQVHTGNDDPACAEKIGTLWKRLMVDGEYKKLSAQEGQPCYGLYTNYTMDHHSYDALAGFESAVCPEGFTEVEIPAGRYARFCFRGDVQTSTMDKWKEIWAVPLPRAFTVDFEEYRNCDENDQADICIYIALADICQSCGMPMTKPEQYGTEADGSLSRTYCTYCYQNGSFTTDCSMEEMIELNLKYAPDIYPDPDEARKQMKAYFPSLLRWQKNK